MTWGKYEERDVLSQDLNVGDIHEGFLVQQVRVQRCKCMEPRHSNHNIVWVRALKSETGKVRNYNLPWGEMLRVRVFVSDEDADPFAGL